MLAQPHAKKRSMNFIKIFLSIILITTLLFVCGSLYLIHVTPPDKRSLVLDLVRMVFAPEQVEEDAFPGKDRITILVMGLDVNWTRNNLPYTKGARSDTMILANIFLKEKKVRLLSIPRDTRVQIPEIGWEKINAAHSIGGPALSKQTAEKLLGTHIDYYMVLKFNGLKHMVDAVGGIELDVEKNMDYDDSWGQLHIHFTKGRQRLNGQKAMEYSRFRNDAESDYGRIRRQQQVIKALQREVLRPENISKIPELVKTAFANITTNLTQKQLLALGFSLRNLLPADMRTFTLPTVPKDYIEGGYWISYVEIVEERKTKILQQFHTATAEQDINNNDAKTGPALTVEILNGSGDSKRAEKASAILREAGFNIVKVTSLTTRYKNTVILDFTGRGNGLIVVKLLHYGEPITSPNPDRKVDITVLIGQH